MIDVSDGVASDCVRLAEASGVSLEVELDRLPLDEGVDNVAEWIGVSGPELAATGGEDYELLFCLPPERWDQAAGAAGVALTRLGQVEAGSGVTLLDAEGVAVRGLQGYEHH